MTPDREKVIKGLNDIGGFIAGRIGFEQARNFLRTIDDAIELLKEQQKGKIKSARKQWKRAVEKALDEDRKTESKLVADARMKLLMGLFVRCAKEKDE